MTPIRIFISSVQGEFARERRQLRDYLRGDPLMRRFFEVFFEDAPASDRRPDEIYLDEVERCEIYVGLFGIEYGFEDPDGISPTEREYDRATELGKHRLVFLKGADGGERHPKMQALIGRAQAGLVRRRFATTAELVAGLYAALVQYLEARQLLRFGPFDAARCSGASLDDLNVEGMYRFIRIARRSRQLPLPEETPPADLLRHLNLLNSGRLTNAAVLLFGKAPQRFLISSEVKCAHFHGTEVAKPIPSYQVHKGTVFELVDQAADFVLSKIALAVGTRAETVQAPVAYEIPKEVVTEAIVNAVAHRDYTDNSSVQVMLFADRLEVMNSGRLPPPLTVEKLRVAHQSLPANPLIAESMYLLRYIEKMGTGTLDMIRRCAAAGLPEPEFEAGAGFVTRIWRPTVHEERSASAPAATQETQEIVRSTTQKPRETTQKPRETTQKPRETTQKPRETTQKPRETTQKPRETTQKPRETTQKPRETTQKPRETTQKPRETTQKPRETTQKPRETTQKPRETTQKPRETTQKPRETIQKPRETTQKPRETTQKPRETTQKPRETTQKTTRITSRTTQKSAASRILECLRVEPELTRAALAERVGLTPDGVKYHLKNLKAAGVLRRVGSDRAGHWEVVE